MRAQHHGSDPLRSRMHLVIAHCFNQMHTIYSTLSLLCFFYSQWLHTCMQNLSSGYLFYFITVIVSLFTNTTYQYAGSHLQDSPIKNTNKQTFYAIFSAVKGYINYVEFSSLNASPFLQDLSFLKSQLQLYTYFLMDMASRPHTIQNLMFVIYIISTPS